MSQKDMAKENIYFDDCTPRQQKALQASDVLSR
jgi:hypothetical protein